MSSILAHLSRRVIYRYCSQVFQEPASLRKKTKFEILVGLFKMRKQACIKTVPFGQYLCKDIIKEEVMQGKNPFGRLSSRLKNKIFLQYLKNGVILTKDNLTKGARGVAQMLFLQLRDHSTSLRLFDCSIGRSVWNAVSMSFNIQPPSNIENLFGSWLAIFLPKLRNQILFGTSTLCWALC